MELLRPGGIYHIYNRGNGQDFIFKSDENYAFFLRKYGAYVPVVAETIAYCLIPNHFHLADEIKDEFELRKAFPKFKTLESIISKQFSMFFSSYAQSFNKVYDRKGSLFIKNFRRKRVEDKVYLTNLIKYIHHNPVHHGLVKYPEDWQWSSYKGILQNKSGSVELGKIEELFSSREKFIYEHLNFENEYDYKHLEY